MSAVMLQDNGYWRVEHVLEREARAPLWFPDLGGEAALEGARGSGRPLHTGRTRGRVGSEAPPFAEAEETDGGIDIRPASPSPPH